MEINNKPHLNILKIAGGRNAISSRISRKWIDKASTDNDRKFNSGAGFSRSRGTDGRERRIWMYGVKYNSVSAIWASTKNKDQEIFSDIWLGDEAIE